MNTLANALKDEIRRLARKEIRAQTGKYARAVTQYRRDIARLKRQQHELERKLEMLRTQARKAMHSPAAMGELNGEVRFSARSVKSQRRRLGLSAADYGRLVGVSPLTIYNWEQNKTRPRKEQFAALVAVRGIGKREAQAKLAMTNGKQKPARKARRRRRRS